MRLGYNVFNVAVCIRENTVKETSKSSDGTDAKKKKNDVSKTSEKSDRDLIDEEIERDIETAVQEFPSVRIVRPKQY